MRPSTQQPSFTQPVGRPVGGAPVDTVAGPVDVELVGPAVVEDDTGAVPLRRYISNLLPAPQYSYPFPGHIKLQSVWVGA